MLENMPIPADTAGIAALCHLCITNLPSGFLKGTDSMKSIFILLTRSHTLLSRLIGGLTGDPYTHVSIAFDKGLTVLYSFARRWASLPLPAGLVCERLDAGYYGRHGKIPCALLELQVSDEVHARAQERLEHMLSDARAYKYSILGLAMCKLNRPYRRQRYYFCSQFVGELLVFSGALTLPKPSCLMRPTDYDLLGKQVVCRYRGALDLLRSDICA